MSEIQMGTIQWFPGHMTKTRRMIAANLSLVDADLVNRFFKILPMRENGEPAAARIRKCSVW